MKSKTFGSAYPLLGVLLVVSSGALTGTAHALPCGDANRSGSVTVADGVLILRAAAGLGTAPSALSDLNQDRRITVADGVLALRRAASLPGELTCTQEQSVALSENIAGILEIGIGAIPSSSSASAARTTTPCADGGSSVVDDAGIEYFDCQDGDVVTNGRVRVSLAGGEEKASYEGFSTRNLSSGETTTVSGELRFSEEGSTATAEGTLNLSSNLLGDFVEELTLHSADQFESISGGSILLTIQSGKGLFEGVAWIFLQFTESGAISVDMRLDDGSNEGFVVADKLCGACVRSQECGAGLFCFPCVGDCSAGVQRCGVTYAKLVCTDGIFGPSLLCTPCESSSQCGDQLGCFECVSEDCSGAAPLRCSDRSLKVLCEDGFF
jgi:hypothetical protein